MITSSRSIAVSLVVVAATFAACARKPEVGLSTNTAARESVAAVGQSMPGQLPKSIEKLSGEEFYRFTHSLQWGGGIEASRNCSGNKGCLGSEPLLYTTVRVDAVNGQDSLLATFGPANGVVAARALNTGKLEEAKYGFKPNKNLEYYAIVLPDDATKGRYIIEELDVTPGARSHRTIRMGAFKPCNHPFQKGRAIRAAFYRCDDAHDMSATVSLVGYRKSTELCPKCRQVSDPIWIDCALGCCIID